MRRIRRIKVASFRFQILFAVNILRLCSILEWKMDYLFICLSLIGFEGKKREAFLFSHSLICCSKIGQSFEQIVVPITSLVEGGRRKRRRRGRRMRRFNLRVSVSIPAPHKPQAAKYLASGNKLQQISSELICLWEFRDISFLSLVRLSSILFQCWASKALALSQENLLSMQIVFERHLAELASLRLNLTQEIHISITIFKAHNAGAIIVLFRYFAAQYSDIEGC